MVTSAYDPNTYMALSSDSYDVTGNVSELYTARDAKKVGGMFQKQTMNGTLEVEILKGGDLIDPAVTMDIWRAVLVTTKKED
jgi:hypothetical protein